MTDQREEKRFDEAGAKILDEIIESLRMTLENLDKVRADYANYSYKEVELLLGELAGLDIRSKILLRRAFQPYASEDLANYILRPNSE